MLNNIFEIVWSIPAVLIAITIHEYSHGRIAYKLGDPTAAEAGRLTLNPLAHLDPVGTLMLLLFRFGWAKPVPVNFNNLNNPKRDMIYVSLAGPIANILTAVIFAFILRLSYYFIWQITFVQDTTFFNLIITLLRGWLLFLQTGVIINLALAIFNLIPVPPLDGSKILLGFLPYPLAYKFAKLESYGYGNVILLILVFSGVIGKVLFPIVFFLFRFLV
ncbi:site-2 protease family protein [Candidatus Atribacteria bacterium MT.SAG.1]|nr:site-2 protease family protein [Candidatus Atribacteria bacterium MT.SAG.1]